MGQKEKKLRRKVELMLSTLLHDYDDTDGIKVRYVEQMLMDVLGDTSGNMSKYYKLIRDIRVLKKGSICIPPPQRTDRY